MPGSSKIMGARAVIETEFIFMDENNNFVTLVICAVENRHIKIGKVIVNDGIAPLDWFGCRGLLDCRITKGASHWECRERSGVGRWRHGVKRL